MNTVITDDEVDEVDEGRQRHFSPAEWNTMLIVASVGLGLLAVLWATLLDLDHRGLYDTGTPNYVGPVLMMVVATPLFWGTVLHAIIRSAVTGALENAR